MKQDVFLKKDLKLNEAQTMELVRILTKRCGEKTKIRIESLVRYAFNEMVRNISCFDRFYIAKYDNDIHYCAGQSYPCEIKHIRKEMLRKYP